MGPRLLLHWQQEFSITLQLRQKSSGDGNQTEILPPVERLTALALGQPSAVLIAGLEPK